MSATSDRIQDDVRNAIADDPRSPPSHRDRRRGTRRRGHPARHGRQLAEQRAATADARRTRGVDTVDDELRVRLMDRDQREDADIRGAALQRLMWDPELVADYLNVEVKDGWVTLKGDVDHQYQSDLASDHASRPHGVTSITNEIDVVEQL